MKPTSVTVIGVGNLPASDCIQHRSPTIIHDVRAYLEIRLGEFLQADKKLHFLKAKNSRERQFG